MLLENYDENLKIKFPSILIILNLVHVELADRVRQARVGVLRRVQLGADVLGVRVRVDQVGL